MKPLALQLTLAACLLFAVFVVAANADAAPGDVKDDLWRQLAGTGTGLASQSCSIHYTTTSANPIPLAGGSNYMFAVGMSTGGLSPASITMHVSGNGTTLITQGPLVTFTTGGGLDPTSVVVWYSGGTTGQAGFYNITQFRMPYSASVYFDYSYSGGGSCFTSDGFNVPPLPSGLTSGNQLYGWVSDVVSTCSGCTPSTKIVGYMLNADLAQLGESGVISGCTTCPEATKTPTTTSFNWQLIGNDQVLVNLGSNGANHYVAGYQSFTPNTTTQGKYLDTSTIRVVETSAQCNGATMSIAVSSNNSYPWSTSSELANITFHIGQSTGATSTTLTLDWSNGLVTADDPTHTTISSITAGVGGNNYAVGSSTFLGNFPVALVGSPVLYYHWNIAGAADMVNCGALVSGVALYNGGDVYTDGGTAWTQQAGQDLNGLSMSVYGGIVETFSYTVSAQNAGGAYYAYVCEVQKDSVGQLYRLSSSFGGGARLTSYQAAGQQICGSPVIGAIGNTFLNQDIQEWRLGYDNVPRNATAAITITLNTTGSARNLLYAGTFAGSQPLHQHLSGPFGFTLANQNAFLAYDTFTTNDYNASLTVSVHACVSVAADGSCSDVASGTLGPSIPNGTYSGTISSVRAVSGVWDASGNFTLTGQDIQGGAIALTIAATGYVTDNGVVISVPSASGNYTVNLTMLPAAQGTGLGVVQSSVRVTFNATNPQFNSGQLILVSINRTLNVDLWVILFQIDQNGNPAQARGFAPYDWTPSQTNELDVVWPDGRALNDADSGSYVLGVFIKASAATKGVLVAFDSIGVNQAAGKVGTSLLTNLNVAGQNDISQQAQVNGAVTSGAITEATVQQDFLAWLDWFPRTDLFVPNAVLYPALFMIGALMLRFGRQSWGR